MKFLPFTMRAAVCAMALWSLQPTAMADTFAPTYYDTTSGTLDYNPGSGPVTVPISGPFINVQSYGAVPDGATDNTTAIQNAINACPGNGCVVWFPPSSTGSYCTFSGVTIAATAPNAVTLRGASSQSSVLDACNHDATVLTVNGNYARVADLTIYGRGAHPADTFTITKQTVLVTGAYDRFDGVSIIGGSIPLYLSGGGANHFRDIIVNSGYSTANVYGKNTQAYFDHAFFDQGFPVSNICCAAASFPAWAATTAYSVGNVVSSGGFYIQASVAGTSGATAPTLKPYNAAIADGTVTWKLVSPVSFADVQMDTGSTQWYLHNVDMSGPFSIGFEMSNSLSGAAPFIATVTDSSIAESLGNGVLAAAGSGLTFSHNTVDSCVQSNCTGVQLGTGWTGGAVIEGNLIYDATYDVLDNGGVGMTAQNNILGGASYGVYVNAGVSDFSIGGNQFVNLAGYGGAVSTGVTIAAGASDHYQVVNNMIAGASVGVSDGGTGAHKTISGNN